MRYYTVHVVGKPQSEYRDFQKRMKTGWKNRKQVSELNRLIEQIGKYYGADDRYFAREGSAERLPGPHYRFIESDGEIDFGLRLYCIRLSDKIVVLLNGDRKTAQNPKNCPNCKPHFEFANLISDVIYQAKLEGNIEFEGFDILMEEGFKLKI